MTSDENKNGKMADLPDPCAQALSSYILVTSFYDPWRHKNNVVSLLAVFSIVTQRMWEERCVTNTAVRETNNNAAEGGKSIKGTGSR